MGDTVRVIKTTTDKLERALNDPSYLVVSHTHTGGRDWVLVVHDYATSDQSGPTREQQIVNNFEEGNNRSVPAAFGAESKEHGPSGPR